MDIREKSAVGVAVDSWKIQSWSGKTPVCISQLSSIILYLEDLFGLFGLCALLMDYARGVTFLVTPSDVWK